MERKEASTPTELVGDRDLPDMNVGTITTR